MNYKYYKTFCFFNIETEIGEDEAHRRKFYYRFYFDLNNSIEVGERFLNDKFDQIFYKEGKLEVIEKYHKEKFPNRPEFHIIQNLSEFTILLKIYKSGTLEGAEMFIYDNKYKQIENLIFDRNFHLQEFHRNLDENGHNRKKIFLAYDWRLFDDY